MDLGRVIGAVTRVVGDREYEGKLAKVVVASVPTTRHQTTCGTRSPTPSAFRVGFYRYPAICGWADGISSKGTPAAPITQCEPPKTFAVTWEYAGQTSWVNVRLTGAAGRTELELEHVGARAR